MRGLELVKIGPSSPQSAWVRAWMKSGLDKIKISSEFSVRCDILLTFQKRHLLKIIRFQERVANTRLNKNGDAYQRKPLRPSDVKISWEHVSPHLYSNSIMYFHLHPLVLRSITSTWHEIFSWYNDLTHIPIILR